MAKFCGNCGKEVADNEAFCGNCGASMNGGSNSNVTNNTMNVQNTNADKDYTVAGFVCSLIGFLCCTYVAIPGLVLSIMSFNDMKSGKIPSDKKWMPIVGIVFSALGLLTLLFNLINPNGTLELVEELLG